MTTIPGLAADRAHDQRRQHPRDHVLVDTGTNGDTQPDPVLSSLEETLRLLQRSVGYWHGWAVAVDPEILLPTQFAATFESDAESARRCCLYEVSEESLYPFPDLARADSTIATLSLDSDARCLESLRWQEFLAPLGITQELRAALVDGRGVCWGLLAIYRRDTFSFTRSDIEAVRRLLPERASKLGRSMVEVRVPGTPSEPTAFLIDKAGRVLQAPNSAQRWLESTRSSGVLDRVGMILAGMAAYLYRRVDPLCSEPSARVRMRSDGGSWTTLIAHKVENPSDSGPQGIPVVVMATDPEQLFSLQVAAFGLSSRETEVIKSVLRGLDTKTMSRGLGISVNTVQDHLKSIFDKIGVHSRRELYLRFGYEPRPTN
jgi:DNA-binding CsgD family transcriptional regulator